MSVDWALLTTLSLPYCIAFIILFTPKKVSILSIGPGFEIFNNCCKIDRSKSSNI